MKIVSKLALAAVTTAGLAFATSAPAAAVGDHKHCLYTPSPQGYILIAQGVSEEAPHEPALHNFHDRVHLGEPGQHIRIIRIDVDAECPEAPEGVASEE